MENKNLTAVEWLLKEQFNLMMDSDKLSKRQYLGRKFKIEEHAKQMEKEQIINAWEDGKGAFSTRQPEQYYNETYGGESDFDKIQKEFTI